MSFFRELTLHTSENGFTDITGELEECVHLSSVREGICVVFCPHTTAGITINENADPDVRHDLALTFRCVFPPLPEYRHAEGNSDAHMKASLAGAGETLIVRQGRLLPGTWQAVYFCEFDAPRTRRCRAAHKARRCKDHGGVTPYVRKVTSFVSASTRIRTPTAMR